MHPVLFPSVRPFEVWFVPEHVVELPARGPLRVGQRLLHYDDAVTLADTVARELPAYGLQEGHLLVIWTSSTPKVLNTVRVPSSGANSGVRSIGMRVTLPCPETVRLVLEDLQQLTRLSDPIRQAPLEWVERYHAVLRVIAGPEDQARFRLGGGQDVTMDLLHRRVADVRHLADRVAAQATMRRPGLAKMVPFARGTD